MSTRLRLHPLSIAVALSFSTPVQIAVAEESSPSRGTLPAVSVSAEMERDSQSTESEGLMAVRPSTGISRLPATVREQAQTINILPAQLLEDRNILSVHEAIESLAGVRPVSPAYASRSAGIRVRGFESFDTFINGFRFSGFGIPVDSGNIESIEVIRGPAGVQFGLAEPGGALNIVTKRPVADPMASTRLTLGSFDTQRLDVDLGGALDASRKVLSRLNLSVEGNEEHRDFDKNRRFAIAPALTLVLSDKTTVDLELGYLRNDYRFNRGLPPRQFILSLPESFSAGEPNQPLSKNESTNFFYTLQHRLGDGSWTFRQRAGTNQTRSRSFEINAGVNDIDGAGNLERSYFSSYQKEDSWALQHELLGTFKLAGLEHKALFGFEVGETGREYGFRQVADPARDIPALNVFNPVYGGYSFPTESELQDSYPPETYGNRFKAIYADWQTQFSPQWRALMGLRLDQTKGYYKAADGSAEYAAADSRGFSPRLGVVWTPVKHTDLFANFSTGFSPNLFSDAAGNLFDDPEKSRQIEMGVRHELIPDRLRITTSVFSITKRNVQTPDPSDPSGNRSILAGEQQSEGLEIELAGAVSPRWDILLGYANMDAKTTRDSNPAQVGRVLVDAPQHSLTAWTKYKPAALPGWWVGYGMAYADERRSSSANADFNLPSYTRHDLAAGYSEGPWSWQANLGNLTNERVYFTHGNNIHLQPERNFRISATYRF